MHFAPPDETHERESPSLFQLSGPTIPRGQRWKALASPSYRVIVPPPTRGSISQAAKETVNSRHGCCFSDSREPGSHSLNLKLRTILWLSQRDLKWSRFCLRRLR